MIDNQGKELEQKGGDLSDKIREIISGKKNLDYWLGKLSMDTTMSEFKDAANFCVAVHNLILEMQEQLTATQQKLDSAVEALKFYAKGEEVLLFNNKLGILEVLPGGKRSVLFGDIAKAALAAIKE